jgi:hypothetical protein
VAFFPSNRCCWYWDGLAVSSPQIPWSWFPSLPF